MGGMGAKGKDAIINLVNPKLKSFDKPLILSVLIGSVTLIGVMSLTMQMMAACETASAITTADMASFREREMKSATYRCILDTKVTMIRANPCYDANKPEVGQTNIDLQGDSKAFCFVNYMEECTVKGKYQTMDLGMDDAYCPESSLSDKVQGDSMELDSTGETSQVLEHCAYQNLQGEWVLSQKQVVVTYKTCPTLEATLGAALGYSTYIELVATVIFITVLLNCGVIRTSLVGNLSEILQRVVDEEEEKGGKSSTSKTYPEAA